MKVLPLLFIWIMSFLATLFTCVSPANPTFWISLIVLAYVSIYMSKNHKRLEIEFDELFGE